MNLLNDLDLRQLEAFAAVIAAGSVTAAAKALNRSQPVVSRQLQELELSLGYPLFIRNGPRIHPSEEALQLHQYVQKALLSLQQIRLRAQEIAQQQQRPLSIAATPALAAGLLPQALACRWSMMQWYCTGSATRAAWWRCRIATRSRRSRRYRSASWRDGDLSPPGTRSACAGAMKKR